MDKKLDQETFKFIMVETALVKNYGYTVFNKYTDCDDDAVCPICTEDIKNIEVFVGPCGHVTCYHCLIQLMVIHKNKYCPECKVTDSSNDTLQFRTDDKNPITILKRIYGDKYVPRIKERTKWNWEVGIRNNRNISYRRGSKSRSCSNKPSRFRPGTPHSGIIHREIPEISVGHDYDNEDYDISEELLYRDQNMFNDSDEGGYMNTYSSKSSSELDQCEIQDYTHNINETYGYYNNLNYSPGFNEEFNEIGSAEDQQRFSGKGYEWSIGKQSILTNTNGKVNNELDEQMVKYQQAGFYDSAIFNHQTKTWDDPINDQNKYDEEEEEEEDGDDNFWNNGLNNNLWDNGVNDNDAMSYYGFN
jgi:hypothetical protein